jgi:hypothetical protein
MRFLQIHSHWFYTDYQSSRSTQSELITLLLMWYYWDLISNLIHLDVCVVLCRKYKHQGFFLEFNSTLCLVESVLDTYFMLLFVQHSRNTIKFCEEVSFLYNLKEASAHVETVLDSCKLRIKYKFNDKIKLLSIFSNSHSLESYACSYGNCREY